MFSWIDSSVLCLRTQIAATRLLLEDDAILLDPNDPSTGQEGWGGDLDEMYSLFPDCEVPDPEEALFVVPMQRARISETTELWVARCIVVTPSSKDESEFRRVGVVLIRYSNKKDDPFNFSHPGGSGNNYYEIK
ncbi:D-isomer specific 2-hydroxyacid dehydrogenase [Apiospora arundinis]